jgi:hypothetical protein
VLDVSEKTHELVGDKHYAADSETGEGYLTGAVVQVDNKRPSDGSVGGPMTVHVGGSTLHEAATEVVECIANLAADMPEWVASSDGDLAKVVAEHFTLEGYSSCKVISLEEVSA